MAAVIILMPDVPRLLESAQSWPGRCAWPEGPGFGFCAGIASSFGSLFLLWPMEQAALAIGALMCFAVLSGVMILAHLCPGAQLPSPNRAVVIRQAWLEGRVIASEHGELLWELSSLTCPAAAVAVRTSTGWNRN